MSVRSQQVLVTPAVVLRLSDYGEADRIVTLLTAACGKVSALAKGARRSRRRFGAALAPFGCGEATLRERRDKDLWLLEDLHSSAGFPHLGQELGRFSHASYACELCLHLCPPHEPEPEVLTLLIGLLSYLDGLPIAQKPPPLPLRVFELRLLRAVGLGLQLQGCAACGQRVPPAAHVPFDLPRGGVLCPACSPGLVPTQMGPLGGGLAATVRAALLALHEQAPDSPSLHALALPRSTLVACRDLLMRVIQHHLGRNLRALEFIAKLNSTSPELLPEMAPRAVSPTLAPSSTSTPDNPSDPSE